MPEDNAKDIFADKTPTEIAAYYFERGHSPEEVKEIMNRRKINFPTISQVMNEFIGRKNLSVESISAMSDINASTIYRIMNGDRNPSRNAIIRIAMAMTLTFKETQVLLKSANLSLLSAARERDLIIMEGIAQEKDYETVNEALKARKMSDLSIRGE